MPRSSKRVPKIENSDLCTAAARSPGMPTPTAIVIGVKVRALVDLGLPWTIIGRNTPIQTRAGAILPAVPARVPNPTAADSEKQAIISIQMGALDFGPSVFVSHIPPKAANAAFT